MNLETAKLKEAMDWVIPPDYVPDFVPGAGTGACLRHLLEILSAKGEEARKRYQVNLPTLSKADLDDPTNLFAQEFILDVKNAYYGFPDTGAWDDIGFRVSG